MKVYGNVWIQKEIGKYLRKYLKKKNFSKKKSILIIGASGFIGSNLLDYLDKFNYKLTAISKNKDLHLKKKISHIKLDVSKYKELKKKIKNEYDVVINLSGYINHKIKSKVYDVHYRGAKNLIDFFRKKNIKQFIQIGSSIEYGKKKSPHFEPKFLRYKNTFSYYGNAKYKISKYILDLYKKERFPFIILRPYIVYGPRQTKTRLIPECIISCLRNKEFKCSSGIQTRDFIFITDFNKLIKKIIDKNISGEIFNAGTGKPIQVKKAINLIKKKAKGGKPLFGKIPLRSDEILNLYPNINKAKKILNWKPKFTFEKGIDQTINYYKKNDR